MGIMVYLKKIDSDIFEFVIPFKGEIWSSYLIITGAKTKSEIAQAAALILASATATIDYFLGDTDKVNEKTKGIVKSFEGARKNVESLPN